ncbi:MAG: hypothetical protein DMF90_25415 [Acidobacteria bacterium]|nr:MAG: hypothetical protein DMF90_25415 [Acidobacteriota bacterium]
MTITRHGGTKDAFGSAAANVRGLGRDWTVGMLLAAIGLYGVISYSVDQRRREIGIRLAVGAGVQDVRNLVLGQGIRLTEAGVLIGMVAALALTPVAETLLFDVSAHDTVTFVAVPLISVWLPVRPGARRKSTRSSLFVPNNVRCVGSLRCSRDSDRSSIELVSRTNSMRSCGSTLNKGLKKTAPPA